MSTPLNMSHRNYVVIVVDCHKKAPLGNDQPSIENISIEKLLAKSKDNDFEYMYAMHEELDAILDLKNGESMYFQPIRDGKYSKGIITRNDK